MTVRRGNFYCSNLATCTWYVDSVSNPSHEFIHLLGGFKNANRWLEPPIEVGGFRDLLPNDCIKWAGFALSSDVFWLIFGGWWVVGLGSDKVAPSMHAGLVVFQADDMRTRPDIRAGFVLGLPAIVTSS
eukprot:420948-Amphidinium_carterae.1